MKYTKENRVIAIDTNASPIHLAVAEVSKTGELLSYQTKMSTFGLHRLDWLMVSKRLPRNAKYETVYRWFVSFIVIYTIMGLKS